jgi:hypothetical protein
VYKTSCLAYESDILKLPRSRSVGHHFSYIVHDGRHVVFEILGHSAMRHGTYTASKSQEISLKFLGYIRHK